MSSRFVDWRKAGREAIYAIVAGITGVVVAVLALRITPSTLTERWLTGGADQVLHYMLFTSAADAWPYLPNSRMGFPADQNLFFAPLFDPWSSIFAWVMGRVINDGIIVLNVYYLLTFFTVAVTAYLFLRSLRVQRWVATLFAVVFAVIPYHYVQIALGHPFLASYWPVPLIGILVLMIAGPATNPFETWIAAAETTGMRRARRWIPIGLLALTVGLSQSYYFVFAGIIVGGVWLFTVIRSLIAKEGRGGLLWPTATLVSLFLVIGVQLVILSFNWGDRFEKYFAARTPGESELYGGKITSLLLPWTDSGLPLVGRISTQYAQGSPIAPNAEGPWMPTLGVIGVVLIVVWIFLRLIVRNATTDTALSRFLDDKRVSVFSVTFLWALFFYLTAGLGAIFAFVVSPEIRAWSRMGVVLALFGIAMVALVVSTFAKRTSVKIPIVIALVLIALVDQNLRVSTALPLVPAADTDIKTFVTNMEDELAPDCGVVQLPLKSFPESGNIDSMGDYDEAFPYIYSTTDKLRYSYGAVRGTYSAEFWRPINTTWEFEKAIGDTGACAVLVDTYAYQTKPNGWQKFVATVADPDSPSATSRGDRFLLFTVTG